MDCTRYCSSILIEFRLQEEVKEEIDADVEYQQENPGRSADNDPVWNAEALQTEVEEGRERLVTDDDFGGERWSTYIANRPHDDTVEAAKRAFSSPGQDWETLYRFLPTVIDSPTNGPASAASFMRNAFCVGLFSDW